MVGAGWVDVVVDGSVQMVLVLVLVLIVVLVVLVGTGSDDDLERVSRVLRGQLGETELDSACTCKY